jgi:hypothetical protein
MRQRAVQMRTFGVFDTDAPLPGSARPYAHPSRISANPATNHHRRRDAACAQRLAQHHHRDERAGAGSPRRSPTARRRRQREADEAAVALPAGKAAAE